MEPKTLKILTPLQKEVLKGLFEVDDICRHFYLTGGTALSAFHLFHRYSDDLDLFTHSIELESIERVMEDQFRKMGLTFAKEKGSPTFRRYKVGDELQVDVVRDIDYRVGAPLLIDGIMIDTKKNIAVNKVTAMLGRLEPKDYVDLYFLLKDGEFDIFELITLGQNKDGGLEPFLWTKIIADAETFSVLPRMIVPCNLADLKKFYQKLREKVVSSLKPD